MRLRLHTPVGVIESAELPAGEGEALFERLQAGVGSLSHLAVPTPTGTAFLPREVLQRSVIEAVGVTDETKRR